MTTVIDPPKVSPPPVLEERDVVAPPKPAYSMRLQTATWEVIDPPWWLVEVAVMACHGKTVTGRWRYCVLERAGKAQGNLYVQLADGWPSSGKWRLEWRITQAGGSYVHYYARRPEDGASVESVPSLDATVVAFRSFFTGKGLPPGLVWTPYNI